MQNAALARAAVAALAAFLLLTGCAGAPPARSDEAFSQIQRGMTKDEVRQRIGSPDETMAFPRTQTDAWTYRYRDTWGFEADFSVTFGAGGQVVSTFSKRIGYGGSGMSQ